MEQEVRDNSWQTWNQTFLLFPLTSKNKTCSLNTRYRTGIKESQAKDRTMESTGSYSWFYTDYDHFKCIN